MTERAAAPQRDARQAAQIAARFPIRLKILLTVLVVIMLVIGTISATMANLFRQDKTAYIHGLTAMMAHHGARQGQALIQGHADDLAVFESVMRNESLAASQKSMLLGELFGSYRDFVAAGLVTADAEPVLVYDSEALATADMAPEQLRAGLASDRFPGRLPDAGELLVRNVTHSERLPLLGIAYARGDGPQRMAVVAWVRLAPLLEAGAASGAFASTLLDARGYLFADPADGLRPGTVRQRWLPDDLALGNVNTAESSRALSAGGESVIAGFAPLGLGDVSLAVRIPTSAAYLTSRALLRNLLVVALGLFAIAGLLTLIFSQRLTRPLESLSTAALAVGRGQFNVRVEAASTDEIGLLSESFNQMTGELEDRDKALEQAQTALIQSEKMAAFGQISAGIAHEVKNPLAGILGYAQLGMGKLEEGHPVIRHLTIIEKETRRCTEIIGNLMKFARRESSVKRALDVNEFIEDSLAIVAHQVGIHGIELNRELAENLPQVTGNANQLEQVMVNLLINAQQAMGDDGGHLEVATRVGDHGSVEVLVRDDGPGMPPEVVSKIFEPFFSTKPSGSGTGLGLAVTYGIVEDHGGTIRVLSKQGEGTTFIVSLPALDA